MWWWVLAVVLGTHASRTVAPLPAAPPPAILIDAETGQVLREQDADARHAPGTLSDLMVVLLSLEEAALGALPLDAPVVVSSSAGAASLAARGSAGARHADPPNRIPLQIGQPYVLSDLLKAIMVGSADDAAVAVAEAIGGSVPMCVELMNARAQRLGMEATHFATLSDVKLPSPVEADTTTARDLARLARALVRHPQVLQWASLSGFPFDRGSIALRNVNQLVSSVRGVDGLLASGSRTAGYSTVATARRRALRLIAVVLGAADGATRYRTAAELLEWGFSHYERLEIVREEEPLNVPIRVVNGSVTQLMPVAGRTFSLLRRRDEEHDFQVRYQVPATVAAPLRRHQQTGEVVVEEGGRLVAIIPLVSPVRVEATGILSTGAAQAESSD